jgi:hypothetical protein
MAEITEKDIPMPKYRAIKPPPPSFSPPTIESPVIPPPITTKIVGDLQLRIRHLERENATLNKKIKELQQVIAQLESQNSPSQHVEFLDRRMGPIRDLHDLPIKSFI